MLAAEHRRSADTDSQSQAQAFGTNLTELHEVAEEQEALRRVATLAASGLAPADLFAAVAEEVGRLVAPIDTTALLRYEADGTATVLASWTDAPGKIPVGERLEMGGPEVTVDAVRTGTPVRMDVHADAKGALGVHLRKRGVRIVCEAPIVVDGRRWGILIAGSREPDRLLARTATRIAAFTELIATAIANAQIRSELAASRSRIIVASDDARRRIERDLHDGAQQRLVSLVLAARAAETLIPRDRDDLRGELSRIASGLEEALEHLQELSRGIHPAILSQGGLGPALSAIARRSAVPVELDTRLDGRLPKQVEVAVYYIISETLANAAKHADASSVRVDVAAADRNIRLSIRDDGVGGADPALGSGLVGLQDRVEAIDGTIEIHSPPGAGTFIEVTLPITPWATSFTVNSQIDPVTSPDH